MKALEAEAITAGAHRTAVWDLLTRTRLCSFPFPPHGHCPNFTGAREAAKKLMSHPEVAAYRTLIVGPERALLPLRKLALESGFTLFVPHQKKEGWYWQLTDLAGARLSQMPLVGEPKLRPEGAQAIILASVAVDRHGGRLGKGFGWGARGLNLGLPEFTIAHPIMLSRELPCAPDSTVRLIGTLREVIEAADCG